MEWIKKDDTDVLETRQAEGVTYLSFTSLDRTGLVKNGFSTRLGGASRGRFSTMNFSYGRGDDPDHVLENYGRMAKALGVDREQMVVSYQTHTTNIRRVTAEDAGKGVVRERDYRDIDGLITDVPGLILVTFYADCVPLYLLDPVHRAIGLSHSGWRGTVGRMGARTIEAMKDAFGTDPHDLIACIGPSICRDCYEVGEDVAAEFRSSFSPEECRDILRPGAAGKYQLDLWAANALVFRQAGVPFDRVHVTNICTRCNPSYLFSHRADGEERGNLAAFLCLKR